MAERPRVEQRLLDILDEEFPRFSPQELASRRARIERAMEEAGATHLLIHAAGGGRSAITWLTEWPITIEAQLVLSPGEKDALHIQYYNHVPLCRRIARDATVGWGGQSTLAASMAELEKRGAGKGKVAVIGPLPFAQYNTLKEKFGEVIDLNRAYYRLRIIKTPEEIDRFRLAAALSDLSVDALIDGIRPGITERDLGDIAERAYMPWGGINVIHFFGVTSMHDPQICVPTQFLASRDVEKGDVVFTEISTNFWDYSGQVLRTFWVGEEPTPLYKELHDAAQATYESILKVLKPGTRPEEIIAAAHPIEDAGFTIYDDLLHGGGGTYYSPVVGSASRAIHPIPDMALEAGMLCVIQPNVITKDQKAGVQTGEMVLITETGAESIHTAPPGPFRVG